MEKLGPGLYRISAHHGFMEEPKMNRMLALAQEKGLHFTMERTRFCLGREKLIIGPHPIVDIPTLWRLARQAPQHQTM